MGNTKVYGAPPLPPWRGKMWEAMTTLFGGRAANTDSWDILVGDGSDGILMLQHAPLTLEWS